jgi:hypothetical protein
VYYKSAFDGIFVTAVVIFNRERAPPHCVLIYKRGLLEKGTVVKIKKALTVVRTTKNDGRSTTDPVWIGGDVTKELFVWTAVKGAKRFQTPRGALRKCRHVTAFLAPRGN